MRATLLLSIFLASWMATPVQAHEWFTGKTSSSGRSCCAGSHCKVISADLADKVISPKQGGYLVTLSQAQAFEISTSATAAIRQMIPWKDVQPSETNAYALCVIVNEIVCFFAPLGS